MNVYSLISDKETESERLSGGLKVTQQGLGLRLGCSFCLALGPSSLRSSSVALLPWSQRSAGHTPLVKADMDSYLSPNKS